MRQKKLIWQIFPANLLIILITMGGFTWYGAIALKDFYLHELDTDLVDRAHLVRTTVNEYMGEKSYVKLKNFCVISGKESATRITVIDPGGKVLADSDEDAESMENHRDRPEIIEAMHGNVGKSLRFSRTLRTRMFYVAIPLQGGAGKEGPAGIIGVLRMSVPATAIDTTLQSIRMKIGIGLVVVICFAAVVALLVSRNISRPLEIMQRGAERMSQGDFSQRMAGLQRNSASLEVAALAVSMDRMAEQLEERFKTIVSQRNELETVFSCMVESVLAVDRNERVLNLNKAASRLFGIEREKAKGRLVQEIIRNVPLQKQIANILETGEPQEDEIVLLNAEGERFLQTNLVLLYDGKNQSGDVLVVMNDVTKLRLLENMRRDFVANVSHELRTPITSIRGYVETLLDEKLEDRENGIKFLEIVLRQSDRLNAIIEDLLSLSRIEQETESGEIPLTEGCLRPVLEAAIQTCQMKADQKNIHLSLDCPDEIWGVMNDTLLEQAVVNLLVNGITYSEQGSTVAVNAEIAGQDRNKILIRVKDTGIGIGREHLPRLFERFYRSDKARSRKVGGTGLGLAIVKHIIQAHGGSVDVQSREGQGATFTLSLSGMVRAS
jgi:two-component system phosphate regulon sensor histidine kinase PhoR